MYSAIISSEKAILPNLVEMLHFPLTKIIQFGALVALLCQSSCGIVGTTLNKVAFTYRVS